MIVRERGSKGRAPFYTIEKTSGLGVPVGLGRNSGNMLSKH